MCLYIYIYITVLGKTSLSKVHKMQQSYRVMHTVVDYNKSFHLQQRKALVCFSVSLVRTKPAI